MPPSSNKPIIKFDKPTNESSIRFVRGKNIDHTFPCHIHHSFTLGVITKGERIIHVDGTDIFLAVNDCFIINPHQPHSYRMRGETDHDYWIISICPQMLRAANWQVKGKDEMPHFSSVRIPDLDIALEMTSLWKKRVDGEVVTDNELTEVLNTLIIRYADRQPEDQAEIARSSYVQQACDYIEDNSGQIVRLHELSRIVNISPFHLNRLFREKIGLPPYTYLLQTRIKRSMVLLLQTGSITEVTYQMGFSDQSHFSRFFKKNVGVSPGQFITINKTGTH